MSLISQDKAKLLLFIGTGRRNPTMYDNNGIKRPQPGRPGLHLSNRLWASNVSGARLSLCLHFTVSGPRGPAQTLLQVWDEAGDGLSVGAAPDLPRFCQQGEAADLKTQRTRHSAAALWPYERVFSV